MADGNEPMIRLEPNGTAPILSYNVPEPTSYAGRNFIDLQLPASYFVQSSTPTSLASTTVEEPGPARPTRGAPMLLSASGNGLGSGTPCGQIHGSDLPLASGSIVPSSDEVAPEFKNIDPDEIRAMASVGKRLNVYRSMYGTLAYKYIDIEAAPAHPIAAAPLRAPVDPITPIPDPAVSVNITHPTPGQRFSGPHTGARIDVQGEAGVDFGSLAKVEVRIGSGLFQQATVSQDGTWQYTETVAQAGTMTVTARATKSGRISPLPTATDSVSITVELQPPPDVTPAVVRIMSPTAGASLLSPATGGPLTVNVTGTANDPGGVRQVEVAVDAGDFGIAVPSLPNDWSQWSRPLSLAPGAHTIKARATDNAGNLGAGQRRGHGERRGAA